MAATFTFIGLVLLIFAGWQGWEALSIWPVVIADNGEQVANLLAIHGREVTIMVAVAAFIGGSLFLCTGALLAQNEPSPPSD